MIETLQKIRDDYVRDLVKKDDRLALIIYEILRKRIKECESVNAN